MRAHEIIEAYKTGTSMERLAKMQLASGGEKNLKEAREYVEGTERDGR